MDKQEHNKYHAKIYFILVVMLILLLGGATFYHTVEKWGYIDALYFTAATMTTVGYGDITPKTDIGRIFTIFYVFAGVGMALYGLTVIVTHFVELRDESWILRLGKIKGHIKGYRPKSLWDKLKNIWKRILVFFVKVR